jgi:serine/threonine protein kinase
MADEKLPVESASRSNTSSEQPVSGAFPALALSSIYDKLIGQVFEGKYLIEHKLGEGAMGVVYQAMHVLLERPVAIKFLHADRITDSAAIERFKQEARAAARIQHPNATSVLDFGVTGNTFYLVMEYLEGRTLRDRLQQTDEELSDQDILHIVMQICEAVEAAHKLGIVHRDLKPDNIFLQLRDGIETVKVLDFGIAKILQEGEESITEDGVQGVFGTPAYMSPEQFQGDPVSPATDVYSIAIITFELLTRQRPFVGNSFLKIGLQHMNDEPPALRNLRPDLPAAVEDVIVRGLSKRFYYRQSSVAQFSEEFFAAMVFSNEVVLEAAEPKSVTCTNPICQYPRSEDGQRCLNCNSLLVGGLVRQRYEVEKIISFGGFGVTYLVQDQDCFNELRVLKELSTKNFLNQETGQQAEKLFQREAYVLLNLQHPGIPKLYAYFKDGIHAYLVQDYIPGHTLLEDISFRQNPFSEEEAIGILLEVADILDYLHSRNPPIIHRDIKPQNLIRHINGRLQLIDFGAVCQLAGQNSGNTIIGSPGYTPPEQFYGQAMPQSDLYALGATIVYLLTGVSPDRLFNLKTAHFEWESYVQASGEFAQILNSLLSPFVEKRPPSAAELKRALHQLRQKSNRLITDRLNPPPTTNPLLQSSGELETPSFPTSSASNVGYSTSMEDKLAAFSLPDAQPSSAVASPISPLMSNFQHAETKVDLPIIEPPIAAVTPPPLFIPDGLFVPLPTPDPTPASTNLSPPMASAVTSVLNTADIQQIASFCYEVENLINSMHSTTYYAFLGVERNATVSTIQAAYEEMAERFHPDHGPVLANLNIDLQEKLHKISQHLIHIQHVLTNPRLREEYDRGWRRYR